MRDTHDMLLSPHDQLWLILGIGGVLFGGILIGAATTHLAQWWAQRKDREALRRAGR